LAGTVYYRNATRRRALRRAAIVRTLRALLASSGYPGASVSLSFVGNAAMRTINRVHRGFDRTTDVLSFPLFEAGRLPPKRGPGGEVLLGDIVISVDVAARQARAYDATLHAEIDRLLIHGLLHLLGHDHLVPADAAVMRRHERRLARAISLEWPYDDA
jgi:probable rRNA maturation factor